MLDRHDVLGIAQTGTGKTASFVLPLLQRVIERRSGPQPKRCGALILVPTRELAQQIANNIRIYGQYISVSVAVVVGGVKPRPQVRALARGIDIVVATPGRLLDHMDAGAINLDRTTSVILDEADQMLDLGFVPAIRKIMSRLPKERQSVLMSATMPAPIRKLAADFQTRPQEISVAAVSRPIERISQSVRHVSTAGKRAALTEILSGAKDLRAIVFTRTKRGADKVCRHLEAAGMAAEAIHGNKSQPKRERTLAAFRAGRISILVATDIAARGIDIDDVSHVINYELPNVAEAYVHRIGRTARAGRSGIAVTLCDPQERSLLRDIEKLIGNKLEAHGDAGQDAPQIRDADQGKASHQAVPGKAKKRVRRRNSERDSGRDTGQDNRLAQPDSATTGLSRMLNHNEIATAANSGAAKKPTHTPKTKANKSAKQGEMATGTVLWFNSNKGFGFIQPSDGGKDVFVHISAVESSGVRGLKDGDRIGYSLEIDPARGKSSAVNLQAQ